ncbi:MAG: NHL repeat-containing protein [Candidatus Solibacter sp.]|nr:NHL repeat-containing protein [Candidatus Solibacter sp.]
MSLQSNQVARMDPAGSLTLVAGIGGQRGFSGDNGPATGAQLALPWGLAVDSAGSLYIVDVGNSRIRKVSNGVITTVAGNGGLSYSGDNGPATSAQIGAPLGVAVDSAGTLYISDPGNGRVRKVSNGVITRVAGTGANGFNGDNIPATSAWLSSPQGIAVDSGGNLYIAEYGGTRIRKVSNGAITTVAGNGSHGSGGDNGPATSAQLDFPEGVAVDSVGNLYISDLNNRVRKVSNGVITTIAGNGTFGFSGDNGPATGVQLAWPTAVAVDSAGNLYFADSQNNRIRKVSNGLITTVAGGDVGDNGPAANGVLAAPMDVAVDSAGNLYISSDNRVRKVSNGVITTVAGNGLAHTLSLDNVLATSAQLWGAGGLALDSAGNLSVKCPTA